VLNYSKRLDKYLVITTEHEISKYVGRLSIQFTQENKDIFKKRIT